MRRRLLRDSLLNHPDFVRLWIGQTVSAFGSRVSQLALPTVAILLLHAGPFQIGVLAALGFLPFPTLGLIAGVWVDRLRRRPIMVIADIGRLVVLISVPAAFLLGRLSLLQLYAVAALVGTLTVFFDVAYQSHLPTLVDRSRLLEGNTKLQISQSASAIGGPALAGFLIQVLGSATAIIADALSFLVSAIAVVRIRSPEPRLKPPITESGSSFWNEARQGLQAIVSNPHLRRLAGCTATANLGSTMGMAVFLPFGYRELHLDPGQVGLILSAGGVGFLGGVLANRRLTTMLGIGPTLAISSIFEPLLVIGAPLALVLPPVATLTGLQLVASFHRPLYNINVLSLRQGITPDHLQGRVNASMRTVAWGTIPLGGLLGGILGSTVGLVPTLLTGGLISVSACLWILAGPVVGIREQPLIHLQARTASAAGR